MTSFPPRCLLLLATFLILKKGNSFGTLLPPRTLHSSVGDTNLQQCSGTQNRSRRTQVFEQRPEPSSASPAIATEITSHADWMEFLHDHDDNRVSIVWFGASFCKTCQRFRAQWNRRVVPAAATNPQLDAATVDFRENRQLFKQLDVKALPTIQFYHQGNLLTSFSCTHKDFGRVLDSMEYYLKASPT